MRVTIVCLLMAAAAATTAIPGQRAGANFPGITGDILVESHVEGFTQTYRLSPIGGPLVPLSDQFTAHEAVASPSGLRVAYVDGDNVWTANIDGTSPQQLTDDPALDGFPVWSPDGEQIAFASDRDGNRNIYVMDADGNNETPLTQGPLSESLPDWSPDGTQVLYVLYDGNQDDIYVMDPDGGNQSPLIVGDSRDAWPSWSPDGTLIAFASNRDGDDEIFVKNPDTDDLPQQLTFNDTTDNAPFWSPDGTQITFTSERDGDPEVFVMNADGSAQIQLTFNEAYECCPSWSALPQQPMVGDADCDGSVDADDGAAGLRSLAGILPAPGCLARLNIFCTDGFTVRDVLLLFAFLAEVELTGLPGECPQPGEPLP